METYKEVNLNDHIKFKPTKKGIELYKEYYKEYPLLGNRIDKVDEDGYVTTQLWVFMSIFGKHFNMGFQHPSEMNVMIEVSDE